MANFNRVILAGNLTRDPQLSYTSSNTQVCEFGMAINRKWRDRDGNAKDEVCYVDMVAYGRPAEVINQYMSKGRPILIEGRLRFRQWTNKEGQKRSRLDVVVDNFQFLGQAGGAGRAGGDLPRHEPAASPSMDADAPPSYDESPPVSDADVPF